MTGRSMAALMPLLLFVAMPSACKEESAERSPAPDPTLPIVVYYTLPG